MTCPIIKIKIMEKIKVTPETAAAFMKNAETYALQMAATAAPEQIERVRKQNDLFDRGLEISFNCRRESSRELNDCEFCGADKLPF